MPISTIRIHRCSRYLMRENGGWMPERSADWMEFLNSGTPFFARKMINSTDSVTLA